MGIDLERAREFADDIRNSGGRSNAAANLIRDLCDEVERLHGPKEPRRDYTRSNAYTYGPDFDIIPAGTSRIRPSRSDTRCPLCGKPVDIRERHAVIEERHDGVLVGGAYAHEECANG